MPKTLLLLDVDCGVDDAQAIMMAIAVPEVEIVGITCCFGNSSIENVCKNVLRVLQVCNKMEIPVFRGATHSILGDSNTEFSPFGCDGLGNAGDMDGPGMEHLQKEHAVQALIRIANQYPGQVSVVAVGPLTNLALAVKIDPTLPKKLNKLCIMGGSIEGRGNRTQCAEFNFYQDPEAAYIVTKEYTCPIIIAALEFIRGSYLSMDFFYSWVDQDTTKAKFMKRITARGAKGQYFIPFDSFAVAAAVDENIITESLECAVSVELYGKYARGMMVLDTDNKWNKEQKAVLIKKCNLEIFKERLWAALQ